MSGKKINEKRSVVTAIASLIALLFIVIGIGALFLSFQMIMTDLERAIAYTVILAVAAAGFGYLYFAMMIISFIHKIYNHD